MRTDTVKLVGAKVLAVLISLGSLSAILLLVIFFVSPQVRKFAANKSQESQLNSCTVQFSESMIPTKLREYRRTDEKFVDAYTIRVAFSNGKTPTDSLGVSDDIWFSIMKDKGEKIDFFPAQLKRLMKGELNDEEFNQLVGHWKNENFLISKRVDGEITFLVMEALKPIEGPPFSVSYYDRKSELYVYFGFGEKKANYIDYFEDWYRQVCR